MIKNYAYIAKQSSAANTKNTKNSLLKKKNV